MQKHADEAAACFEAPCGLLRYATGAVEWRRTPRRILPDPLSATWPSLSGKLNGG
ncbi:hypothetical protein RLEG3_15965 [Rhizobium leguminosarum bv. trifolii WSM1689]|nr:hypothetical protein RLEG3_15965 [Rhizobium leguminosarum bv. trifolii WSM1689]